jgi:uncharacterized RDD family membrane protein YckC
LKKVTLKNGVKTDFSPSLLRRAAAILYDAFLLLAIWFFATLLLLPFNHNQAFTSQQFFYPLYLCAVSFGFYGWFWTHGGQTLGLKAWKIKLQSLNQQPVTWQQAAIRFLTALLSWASCGLGFLWIIWDKNGYAWHDYLSKTTLVFDKQSY